MKRHRDKYSALMIIPAILLMLFISACDWVLPTELKTPKWNTVLSIPIINKSYPLSDLAEGEDSLLQVQGDSMFVQFADSLQTVSLKQSNFFVPAGRDPLLIGKSMDGLSFDPLQVGPDSSELPIPGELILEDPGSPGDSLILKDVWNTMADTMQVNDSSTVSVPQSSKDNINEFFSAYSIVIDDSSEFATRIENDTPGVIETVQIALMVRNTDGSTYFLANHDTSNLQSTETFKRTTDLEGKRISNLDIVVITRIIFAEADDDLPVPPGMDPKLTIRSSMKMKMKEVRGIIRQIQLLDDRNSRPMPSANETKIISGVLGEAEADTNRISMAFGNTFPMEIALEIDFLNISDSLGNILSIDTTLPSEGDLNILKNLNSHRLTSLEEGEVMEELVYTSKVSIPEGSDTIVFPFDGRSLGDFSADIRINDFQLASLSGIFNLEMPTPPTSISIPEGMTGIGIAEPSMTLELSNGIRLPIALELDIISRKLDDSLKMSVSPLLNYPQSGDSSANTTVILDHKGMQVYWDGVQDPDQTYSDYPSLADLINLGPDSFIVRTNASVKGEGDVAAGRQIKGRYSVLALFKILPDTQVFLPNDFTNIEPWDSSLADQILNTAVQGRLNSTVISRFPLSGRLSMLLSDSTVFPENRQSENLQRVGVDSVLRDTLYFPDGSRSWVDTLFMVHLPEPKLDLISGAAAEAADTNFISIMDYHAISRLAENAPHYAIPKITLYGTEQAVWVRTSDYIHIRAFIGFELKSDGILGGGSDSSGGSP